MTAAPLDAATRYAYADWLDERGEAEWAEKYRDSAGEASRATRAVIHKTGFSDAILIFYNTERWQSIRPKDLDEFPLGHSWAWPDNEDVRRLINIGLWVEVSLGYSPQKLQ